MMYQPEKRAGTIILWVVLTVLLSSASFASRQVSTDLLSCTLVP